MGFYIEMRKSPTPGGFLESPPPAVFWALYAFAGFALGCMGGAAHTLLGDLAKSGSAFDRGLVWSIWAMFPVYLLIGLKLWAVRRFVLFEKDGITFGYHFFKRRFLERHVSRGDLADFNLVNHRPHPNLAPTQHEDSQYYIRGHWRVVVTNREGKDFVLDRHTEKGALGPLYRELRHWAGVTSAE